MTRVVFDISMSLDGFITGPNAGIGNPMGDDDGRLHDWMFAAKTDADAAVLDEVYATAVAIVMGRRMFDVGVEPWGDPPPFHRPVLVLTHEPQEPMAMKGAFELTAHRTEKNSHNRHAEHDTPSIRCGVMSLRIAPLPSKSA